MAPRASASARPAALPFLCVTAVPPSLPPIAVAHRRRNSIQRNAIRDIHAACDPLSAARRGARPRTEFLELDSADCHGNCICRRNFRDHVAGRHFRTGTYVSAPKCLVTVGNWSLGVVGGNLIPRGALGSMLADSHRSPRVCHDLSIVPVLVDVSSRNGKAFS